MDPEAPPADETTPLTEEEERNLEAFIADFLVPISADGQLEAVEETPLVVAFHAYGIASLFEQPEVKARLSEAMRETLAQPPAQPKALTISQAKRTWLRIRRFPAALSVADLDHLLYWLDRQQGPSYLFADKTDRELWKAVCQDLRAMAAAATLQKKHQFWENVCAQCSRFSQEDFKYLCREHFGKDLGLFRKEPLDRRCLESFYRLMEEARRLVEQQARAAAAPAPPTAAAAPLVPVTPAEAPRSAVASPPPTEAPASSGAAGASPAEGPRAGAPVAPPAPPAPPPPPACKVVNFTCEADLLAALADPEPFRAKIRGQAKELLEFVQTQLDGAGALPFGAVLDKPKVIVVRKLEDVPPNLWFVGDVHGDVLGLEAVLGHIAEVTRREGAPPPVYVFLGDLIDRMPYSYEVLLRFFALWRGHPGRVVLLAGNHTDALRWNEKTGAFTATVNPCEFADWLNNQKEDPATPEAGRALLRLAQRTPRAIFLPDGLLAAHGGVPHRDLHERLKKAEDLDLPECLQDFVWTRLHPRAPRRIPNRSSRTCDVGREDFERFCETAAAVLAQPVRRMVRGHDHVEERYELYANYLKNHVLVINTMCCRQDGEFGGPYPRTPCVARWRKGELPEVHRLTLPAELIRAYYPSDEG
jgi:hypothetical protein